MKKWIHASTRDIEYKTKDYLAEWAKDSCKSGEPMASIREFKEEMKAKGLKADETDYDYYVTCYNNACKGLSKKVKASSDADVEDTLESIIRILEEDYYWGSQLDDVYMYLIGSDSITERDLQNAMNDAAASVGLDSDERENASARNREVAHDIAMRLGL